MAGVGALAGGWWLWRQVQRRPRCLLKDQVVIITGASSGIGWATALAFAREGARLVLAARRTERLTELQYEIQALGTTAMVIATDVTRDEELQALVEGTLAAFGRIDVLVNNAGIADGGPFQDLSRQRLQRELQVNLYGPMRLIQLVLPVMLSQKSGQIVNVSSATALTPWPGMAVYVATRAGLAGFSHTLRRELTGSGVGVSLILPVWTQTEIMRPGLAGRLRSFGFSLDPAERPAAAVVEAVRCRRPIIALGGWLEKLGAFTEARAPELMDWVWRMLVPADFMEIMREVQ
jgi:short-subunit dehydrogenase